MVEKIGFHARKIDDAVLIRLPVTSDMQIASMLKDFMAGSFEDGCCKAVLDFKNTQHVDSTFVGMLVGVLIKYKNHEDKQVLVTNVQQKVMDIFALLGADQFMTCFTHELDDTVPFRFIHRGELSPDALFAQLKDAHETLSSLSEENRKEFKAFLDQLSAEGGP